MSRKRPAIHHHDQSVNVTLSADGSALLVTGSINFQNVVRLRDSGKQLLSQTSASALTVNLAELQHSDNAGLVLLISWLRDAQDIKKTLTFDYVPHYLQQMAQVFGLYSILFENH
jgi:phospholipid transport system transporter-binding protein